MINPTKKDIGKFVIYHGYRSERGIITGFNLKFVFVRYCNELNSKATRREDLTWDMIHVNRTDFSNIFKVYKISRGICYCENCESKRNKWVLDNLGNFFLSFE